eukprot:363077-Chlamydomonas_euryale.AAC.1
MHCAAQGVPPTRQGLFPAPVSPSPSRCTTLHPPTTPREHPLATLRPHHTHHPPPLAGCLTIVFLCASGPSTSIETFPSVPLLPDLPDSPPSGPARLTCLRSHRLRVSVTASRVYKAGEQVFVNYGQSNDTLMQYYGFAE